MTLRYNTAFILLVSLHDFVNRFTPCKILIYEVKCPNIHLELKTRGLHTADEGVHDTF